MPGARRDTSHEGAMPVTPKDEGALPAPNAPTMGRSDAWPTGAVARHLALHRLLTLPRD
jgi:hypothetical protein